MDEPKEYQQMMVFGNPQLLMTKYQSADSLSRQFCQEHRKRIGMREANLDGYWRDEHGALHKTNKRKTQ